MGRVVLVIAVVMLTIYCVVDVAQTKRDTRLLPRWLWAFVVIVGVGIGPVCWLLFGRPLSEGRTKPQKKRIAPDDDDAFLRKLRRGGR